MSASRCENIQMCTGQIRPASRLEYETFAREDWQAPHFPGFGPKLKGNFSSSSGLPKYLCGI